MTLPDLLALLVVVVAVPVNWYVVARLWRLHRERPELRVLRERVILATALSIVITLFALVFLNNGMKDPILDLEATRIVTRSALLALSIPACYWLWIYRR